MKATSLVVAVFAFSTQACAPMMREMSAAPGERPSVANGMGGVGGRLAPASVPSTLPLPIHADPRTRMAVPKLQDVNPRTYDSVLTVYSLIACLFPTGLSTQSASCDEKALQNFRSNVKEPPRKTGPVILR